MGTPTGHRSVLDNNRLNFGQFPDLMSFHGRKLSSRTLSQQTPPVRTGFRYAHQHRTKNSPYVFTNPTMVERHPANPERWCYFYRDKFFKTLCRQAGVPEMGYHTLRHLTASEMASRGASLTDIQKVLGHERATTTDGYLQSLGFVRPGCHGAARG